jgi:hypothetical protein
LVDKNKRGGKREEKQSPNSNANEVAVFGPKADANARLAKWKLSKNEKCSSG